MKWPNKVNLPYFLTFLVIKSPNHLVHLQILTFSPWNLAPRPKTGVPNKHWVQARLPCPLLIFPPCSNEQDRDQILVRNGHHGLKTRFFITRFSKARFFKTRFQVAFLQVKLDFGTLSPSLGRLGAPKLERPPHLACLSEAPCLLSSTGHLSLFGHALTIRLAIQGGVFFNNRKIKEFFFWSLAKKFKKENSKKFKKSNFFFLKISIFPGKNLGFSKKNFKKNQEIQYFFLENFHFFSLISCQNLAFLVRDSSVWAFVSCNFRIPRAGSTLSNVPRASNRNAVQCSTRVQSNKPTGTAHLDGVLDCAIHFQG